MKTFIGICEKNSLKYYLVFGSCLGAVRHKGLIPWDDDIDVAMPREDYEKFMEIGQEYLPDYYFLQNYKSDPEYLACFAKIRDSRTTFIEQAVKNRIINHGVYIDIFPLDYFPKKGVKRYKFLFFLYKARLSADFQTTASAKMRLFQFISKLLLPSMPKARERLNNLTANTPKSDLIFNAYGAYFDKSIMPAEWYGNGKKVPFEDVEVLIPEDYDKYLTRLYGDYMTPPPKAERNGHYTDIIDLDKPYTEYMNK